MRRNKIAFPGFLIILCLGLSGLVAACGSEANPTVQPAAAPTIKVPSTWTPAPPQTTSTPALPGSPANAATGTGPASTPYITPLPEEFQPNITSDPPTGQGETSCTFVADYPYLTLSQQIQQGRDIVQAQVTHIGAIEWNTADGQAPADPCKIDNFQYSPVEITVKELYKGQLAPGSKLVLWVSGGPGSYMQGNYNYFPKTGDNIIFFLGDEDNLRRDSSANPMLTRSVWQIYRTEPPGSTKWVSQHTSTVFTIEWLKAVIKDPAIEPTPTPLPPPPTPYARAGQTLQPAKYYGLDKALKVSFKAPVHNPPLVGSEMAGSDKFNQLVKAFDRPLKVIRNMNDFPYSDTSVFFSFELPDHSFVEFTYFPDTNMLVHQLNDYYNRVELETPPDLKAMLGL